MPPYRYRWRRTYWNYNQNRRRFRRRNTRKNFRNRPYRRRRTVRRKKLFKYRNYRKKKLKRIVLKQWQPDKIRKCKIQGIFPLFQAAPGTKSNNFEIRKELISPPTYPGGGGWSIFQISLNELYKRHERLENWWTYSNKGLPLVRYTHAKLKFYRQQTTDYVVNYQLSYPFELTKFHYMSTQPERMLMYHKKIIVPSFQTSPHMKRTYIKKRISPPKEFYNKWFFQRDLSKYPLVMITTTACDLQSFFISPGAENNTVHLWALNTNIFKHKDFKQQSHEPFGYIPQATYYLYAQPHNTPGQKPKNTELIYLGNSNTRQEGETTNKQWSGPVGTTYPYEKWGNPFWHHYIQKNEQLWITKSQPTTVYTGSEKTIDAITEMTSDILTLCSYNPMADKGYGNEVYFVKLYTLEDGWETPATLDLKITGFPLWIMLWGLEDFALKSGKLQHMETDYALVIKSSYIQPQLPYYVFLSDSFYNGEGPYHINGDLMNDRYKRNWYPSWQYQKEAIEQILMSGPGTNKENHQIQAHMYYNFYFKWGGSPAYVEGVQDPVQQPDYPLPNSEQQGFEIENPETDPINRIILNLMSDEIHLQQQLQKDLKKTLKLQLCCQQMETDYKQYQQLKPSKHSKKKTKHRQRKKKRPHYTSSSSTSESDDTSSSAESTN